MPHKPASLRVAQAWRLWLLRRQQAACGSATGAGLRSRRRAARQAERFSMALGARLIAALTALAFASAAALAQSHDGPSEWQINYQAPASQVMEYIDWFSWYTVVIMALIVLLVIGLIAWCAWKYNERSNPVPSRITHNT